MTSPYYAFFANRTTLPPAPAAKPSTVTFRMAAERYLAKQAENVEPKQARRKRVLLI